RFRACLHFRLPETDRLLEYDTYHHPSELSVIFFLLHRPCSRLSVAHPSIRGPGVRQSSYSNPDYGDLYCPPRQYTTCDLVRTQASPPSGNTPPVEEGFPKGLSRFA